LIAPDYNGIESDKFMMNFFYGVGGNDKPKGRSDNKLHTEKYKKRLKIIAIRWHYIIEQQRKKYNYHPNKYSRKRLGNLFNPRLSVYFAVRSGNNK